MNKPLNINPPHSGVRGKHNDPHMSTYPTIGYFRCNECGKKFIKKAYVMYGDIVCSPADKGKMMMPSCPKCKSTNVKKIINIP